VGRHPARFCFFAIGDIVSPSSVWWGGILPGFAFWLSATSCRRGACGWGGILPGFAFSLSATSCRRRACGGAASCPVLLFLSATSCRRAAEPGVHSARGCRCPGSRRMPPSAARMAKRRRHPSEPRPRWPRRAPGDGAPAAPSRAAGRPQVRIAHAMAASWEASARRRGTGSPEPRGRPAAGPHRSRDGGFPEREGSVRGWSRVILRPRPSPPTRPPELVRDGLEHPEDRRDSR
jgi:hypothetical protein